MNNTNYFIADKEVVAGFADDILHHLKPDSQLTMTMRLDEFGVYCAISATDDLLDVIEKRWGLSFYD